MKMAESGESEGLPTPTPVRHLGQFGHECDGRPRRHGEPGQWRSDHRQCPRRCAPGAELGGNRGARMASRQLGGGGAVAESLAKPRAEVRPHVMEDLDHRFVPASPPGLVEPPHEIDVLADSHRAVEAVDAAQGLDPADECGGWNIRDAGPSPHPSWSGAEVERAAHRVEPLQGTVAIGGADPRCYEGDDRVGEVGEQPVEPPGRNGDIGIDERHELRRHVIQPVLAGRAGPGIRVQPHDLGAVDRRHRTR